MISRSADGDADLATLGKDPVGIITEIILGLLTRQGKSFCDPN